MKRTPMKRRTKPMRQRRREGADVEREPKPRAVPTLTDPQIAFHKGMSESGAFTLAAAVRALRRGTYAGSTSGAAPKTAAYRDRALLDMAENRPCLLLVPGICNHRTDSTVACHSNLGIHGKAGARKADDQFSVWGCNACHIWLDTDSKAPATLKERVFMEAYLRQVLAWRQVAASREPERFRRAARRALAHLNASPIGAAP